MAQTAVTITPGSKWASLRLVSDRTSSRRQAQQGVGPHGAASTAHDCRPLEAVAGNVPCYQPDFTGGERKKVVPVATHRPFGRDVAGGQAEAR